MPRDSSGVMTLPIGVFVTGTTISATDMNTLLEDFRAEIQDSLSRSGEGGMLVAFKVADGTVALPAYAFTSEASSGFYRAGAGDVRAAILGTVRAKLTASGWFVDVLNALTAATTLKLLGNLAAGAAGADVTVDTTATRTAGNLLSVLNNTAGRFTVGYDAILHWPATSPYLQADAANTGFTLSGKRDAADAGAEAIITGQVTRTAGLLLDVQNNTTSKFAVSYAGEPTSEYVWRRVVATADTTTSSGAVDITGLTFACASGKKYLVRATLLNYSAAGTTGLGIGAKSTGAPTTSVFHSEEEIWTSSTAKAQFVANAFADSPQFSADCSSTNSATPQFDRYSAYFVTTGTGTFQMRLITEVGTSQVATRAGSFLEWMEFT